MSPSILTIISGLLLKNDDSLNEALFQRLSEWSRLPYEERERHVLQHLGFYLGGMAGSCPYYARTLGPKLINENVTWDLFRDLPRTRRSTLLEHEEALKSSKEHPAWRPIGSSSTSGSTGTPIVTEQTKARQRLQGQLNRLWHESSARDPNGHVGFVTDPLTMPKALDDNGIKSGRWSAKGNGYTFYLSLLAAPENQLSFLVQRRISVLVTYPSNLRALLDWSESSGVRPERLSQVVLSSEPIPDDLVERAAELWGVKVVATYSTSELAAVALHDDAGVYRIQDASVWVEVLDDDGAPVPDGGTGKIVVTTLQEARRPLIRYEVGDYAEVARSSEGELILKRILGRERTMIHTAGGGQVWPFFELGELAQRRVIKTWQLIQHADRSLTMRVVPTGVLGEAEQVLIQKSVDEMSGGLPLTIQSVGEIEREKSGKFREVISEI